MLRIVCLILLPLLVVGCKTAPVDMAQQSPSHSYPVTSLNNTTWSAQSVASRGLMEHPKLTVSFTESEVSGFSGCNQFKGDYTLLNSRLEIVKLITTRKFCSKVIMFQEYLLLNELKTTLLLSSINNRVIRLTNNNGQVTTLIMQ